MSHTTAPSAFAAGVSSPQPISRSPPVPPSSLFESIPVANSGQIFVNKTFYDKKSVLYWLRMAIQASILVPIRIAITVVLLILIVAVAYAGTLGMSKLDLELPMARWRRIILFPLRLIVRAELAILGFWFVEIEGSLAPRDVAPVLVSNHVGFVEPMLLMAVTGASPLTAAENNNIPFISPIFVALQSIWVEREQVAAKTGSGGGKTSSVALTINNNTPMSGASEGILGPGGATPAVLLPPLSDTEDADPPATRHAGAGNAATIASPTPFLKATPPSSPPFGASASGNATAPNALRLEQHHQQQQQGEQRVLSAKEIAVLDINGKLAYRARNNDYPHLLIFPEGTTTNTDALLAFKAGAFRPFAPIQPVVVTYPHRHYDPSWVSEGKGLYGIIFSLLTQLYCRVHVKFLNVVRPTEQEVAKGPGEGAQLFADRVQCLMARAMSSGGQVRPQTRFTYEDIMLSLVAVAAPKVDVGRGLGPRCYPVPLSVIEFNSLRPAIKPDVLALRRYLKRFIALDNKHRRGCLSFDQFQAFFATAGMGMEVKNGDVMPGPSTITRSLSSSSNASSASSVIILPTEGAAAVPSSAAAAAAAAAAAPPGVLVPASSSSSSSCASSPSSFAAELRRRLFSNVLLKLGQQHSPLFDLRDQYSGALLDLSDATAVAVRREEGRVADAAAAAASPASSPSALLGNDINSGAAAAGATFRQLAILLTVLEERGQQGFLDVLRLVFLALASSSATSAGAGALAAPSAIDAGSSKGDQGQGAAADREGSVGFPLPSSALASPSAFVSRGDFEAFASMMEQALRGAAVAVSGATTVSSDAWSFAVAVSGGGDGAADAASLDWPSFARWGQRNFASLSSPPSPSALNPFVVAFKKAVLDYGRWEDHIGTKDQWTSRGGGGATSAPKNNKKNKNK